MSRYLIVGVIFFIVVFVLFFMIPSSSPVENVEDVKELIEKKEESLNKSSYSVDIEYEAESQVSLSSSSSSSSSSLANDKEKSEIEVIEKLTGEKNLEPLYKEWKQKGDLSYNIYIKKSPKSEESQKLTPPAMPSFTTVEISGEKIGVVMPSGAKGYIVTKDGGEISYQPVDSSNVESIAPPGIGY